MRHDQTIALLGSVIFSIGLANCTTTETTPAERVNGRCGSNGSPRDSRRSSSQPRTIRAF